MEKIHTRNARDLGELLKVSSLMDCLFLTPHPKVIP